MPLNHRPPEMQSPMCGNRAPQKPPTRAVFSILGRPPEMVDVFTMHRRHVMFFFAAASMPGGKALRPRGAVFLARRALLGVFAIPGLKEGPRLSPFNPKPWAEMARTGTVYFQAPRTGQRPVRPRTPV